MGRGKSETGISKWERRKLVEWKHRGMLRADGTLRYGPQFKRRRGRPAWKTPMTDFELGRRKLERAEYYAKRRKLRRRNRA